MTCPARPTFRFPRSSAWRLAPSPSKIEKSFKLKRTEKQAVVAQRRMRLAEENCMARAIYFEARSESELGQLAVARVILNRTKDRGLSENNLRRGLSGFQPAQFLPVLLCL